MWKHFPCTLPNFEGSKVQLFQVGNRTYSFLFTLSKSCTFAPWFFSINFLHIWARSPTRLQTIIEKNTIMILCSICTLIFVLGGKGGCRAGVQEVVVWTAFTLPIIQKGLFFGPKKSRKIDANTGLPSK